MLKILFEDDAFVAVDKPAGVVVHPTYKNVSDTLLDGVRLRFPDAALSVVGRLDKLTSGIVVIAKGPAAHAALQRSWPDAEKEYLAVVVGDVEPERGEIDLPLGTDPTDRRRRMVRPDGAKSVTRYERVARDNGRSVLRCWPLTGRRHQIRVHLASKGWPILGDATYGPPVDGLSRHALHARRLVLTTPAGVRVEIESPIPEDFPCHA